eukprot:7227226-Pyramimonas_sp.AAC.1
MLCVDANASFERDFRPSSTVGPYTAGTKSWKSDAFYEFIVSNKLILSNTWGKPLTGSCTCFYDGKFEPRQIGFVAIGRGPSR